MPNWIINKLTVDNGIEDVVDYTSNPKENNNYMDFNNIRRMPNCVYQDNLSMNDRKIYGNNNWYDWSLMNWGCKWNASSTDFVPDENSIYFDTPWSGVPGLMFELSKRFPNSKFRYIFADEDMFMNTGIFEFQNGKILREEFHNMDYSAYKVYVETYGDYWWEPYNCDYKVYINRQGENIIVRVPVKRLITE